MFSTVTTNRSRSHGCDTISIIIYSKFQMDSVQEISVFKCSVVHSGLNDDSKLTVGVNVIVNVGVNGC